MSSGVASSEVRDFASLLRRPPEQAGVNRFAANMALHGLHHVGSCLLLIGGGLNVQHCVESVNLERVVMKWTSGWRPGSSVCRAGCADLAAAIRKLRALRNTLGKSGGGAWNPPDQPVNLIVGGSADGNVWVMKVQNKTHRSLGR